MSHCILWARTSMHRSELDLRDQQVPDAPLPRDLMGKQAEISFLYPVVVRLRDAQLASVGKTQQALFRNRLTDHLVGARAHSIHTLLDAF